MSSASPVQIPTLEPAPPRSGCVRMGLIGCGGVALLCVLVFVGFVLYSRKNPGFLVEIAMGQIEKNYAPDVTEADRKELRAAVEEFKAAARAGKIKSDGANPLQRSFSVRGDASGKITHAEVQEMIQMFRRAAGTSTTPAPALTPAAVPTPS